MDQQTAVETDQPEAPVEDQAAPTDAEDRYAVKYSHDEEAGVYRFSADGEEVAESIDDLIRNRQQGKMVSRKADELAERDKARQVEHDESLSKVNAELERLGTLSAELEAMVTAEERSDDELLEDGDAAEVLRRQKQREKRAEAIEQAKAEVEAEQTRKEQQRIAEESRALYGKLPEWAKDQSVASAEFAETAEVMGTYGFTSDYKFDDHRVIVMANDLRKLKKAAESAKGKEVRDPPTSIASKKTEKVAPKTLADRIYGVS